MLLGNACTHSNRVRRGATYFAASSPYDEPAKSTRPSDRVTLLALAVFAGALVILDLRFMGTGLTREPLSEIASQARPWLVAGFWGLVVTGLFQLALQPVKEYYSDMFNFKMKVMLVAIIFTFVVRPRLARMDEARLGRVWGKLVGLASLTLWAGVAIPARLIGLVG